MKKLGFVGHEANESNGLVQFVHSRCSVQVASKVEYGFYTRACSVTSQIVMVFFQGDIPVVMDVKLLSDSKSTLKVGIFKKSTIVLTFTNQTNGNVLY